LRQHAQAGGAAVINISSSVTQGVVKNFSVYSAAKAGVDMLTRCWALDFAPDRIRVNAICPGVVETPILATLMPQEAIAGALANFAQATPLGRVGQPADIAELALFLASPQSAWLTGAVIPHDGGLSLVGA
jgi:NAD(P)-dependent dehydrogenase (short-subunit alcohol dehydrogenase family)